jgi:methylated-DNA-[protein]-cysteine S-methyltransferase
MAIPTISSDVLYYMNMPSPVGELWIFAKGNALVALDFEKPTSKRLSELMTIHHATSTAQHSIEVLASAINQLKEYFAGERRKFDLALSPRGTEFQKKTWKVLEQIPFGQTWSYAEEADKLGKPTAARAVGSANGKNPIPILIPCHRVVQKNGDLGGYSSGLKIKRLLLRIEGNSVSN